MNTYHEERKSMSVIRAEALVDHLAAVTAQRDRLAEALRNLVAEIGPLDTGLDRLADAARAALADLD
jgi:ABC-type transporter Mla subunit MlaD